MNRDKSKLKKFLIFIFLILIIVIIIKNRVAIAAYIMNYFYSDEKTSIELVEQFKIQPISTTLPSNFNLSSEVFPYKRNAKIPEYNINMGDSSEYTTLKGITTFRGNNYRDSASYGTVNINEKTFEQIWSNDISSIDTWTGVGWNGQPSIVQWDDEVKQQMNLYEKFKNKEDFTEVIYGTLDSHIYFYDLETGEQTRKPLKVNASIKGSVTIDPRGYPLLYVGQGIDEVGGKRVKIGYYIFSLITGEKLYFLDGTDSFAYRRWGAFDGNPVIDAKTDSIVLPGENGIIYIGKLNTNYNKKNATISIKPALNKYRYTTIKNSSMIGTENSMTVYKNYAYFLDNAGILQCLNLNTFKPVWVYNMGDDCDSTLGLEEEGDRIYLYSASEVDLQAKAGDAWIRKIDGFTGKVIWEKSYKCFYDKDVNGGVLSSPIIGKKNMKDLVIFNIAKTGDNAWAGKMVAFYKSTGKVAWQINLDSYSWSSPVAVYTKQGKGYIVFCDSIGQIFLIDGVTGKVYYKYKTGGGNIEGSPAVFNNIIVIGTRGQQIYGIKIK